MAIAIVKKDDAKKDDASKDAVMDWMKDGLTQIMIIINDYYYFDDNYNDYCYCVIIDSDCNGLV